MIKQTNFVSLLVLCLGLLTTLSCSKETLSDDLTLSASYETLGQRATVVTVSPSGDASGSTDANAIEAALNTAGVNQVILAAGTFYLNRAVNAPVGFQGSLRGQGMNTTRIEGVGDAGTPFQTNTIHVPLTPNPINGSAFFYFPEPGGGLTVADMAMTLPSNFIAANSGFDGSNNLTLFISITLGDPVADVDLRNLRLIGTDAAPGSYPWYFSQPNFAAAVMGDRDGPAFPQPSHSGGKIKVQGCNISQTSYQAMVLEVLKDAKISVLQNSFTKTKQVNIRFLDGCKVKVADNVFNTNSWASIDVTQEEVLGYGPITGAVSDVKIIGNSIVSNGYLGVEIGSVHLPGAAPFAVTIEGNTITMGAAPLGGTTLGGIGVFAGHTHVSIADNVVQGEAEFAVFLEEVSSSEVFYTSTAGFSPFVADYGLIGAADNNTVTATDPATAIDEGSGNTFVGPITVF